MKKTILILAFVFMISVFMNSCDPNHHIYEGSNPELAFLAVHSMLGSYISRDDQLLIIEEDSQGRTLFAYECNSYLCENAGSNKVLAICISQFCSKGEVSFLLNQNVKYVFLDKKQNLTIDLVKSVFNDSEFESLKNDNYWDLSIDHINSSFKMKTDKILFDSVDKEISDSLHNQFGNEIQYAVMVYNTETAICFVRKIEHLLNDTVKAKEAFIVLLNNNKIENCDKSIIEINDLNNYSNQLNDVIKGLMQTNDID